MIPIYKMMISLRFICLLFLAYSGLRPSAGLQAQSLLYPNLEVHVSSGYAIALGGAFYTDGPYESSAFFSNMKQGFHSNAEVLIRRSSVLQIGLGIGQLSLSQWRDPSEDAKYEGMTAGIFSVGPIIQLTTPIQASGLMNRLQFAFQLRPTFNVLSLKIPAPVFEVRDPSNRPVFVPGSQEEKGSGYGLQAKFRLSYSISWLVGLSFSLDGNMAQLPSNTYNEAWQRNALAQVGIFFRLRQNKRFYED